MAAKSLMDHFGVEVDAGAYRSMIDLLPTDQGQAGKNFTDRQRIKRKAARWAAKFAALPPAERVAVLSAILEAGTYCAGVAGGGIESLELFPASPIQTQDEGAQSEPTMPCANCGHDKTEHDWVSKQSFCFYSDADQCCECVQFVARQPMPDSGVTKRSPHESAELGGREC